MNSLALHLEVINCYLNIDLIILTTVIAGLPDKKLYPSVSAVYGNTEVSMVYLGPPLDGWYPNWRKFKPYYNNISDIFTLVKYLNVNTVIMST